tara:strand:+ start:1433 stop:2248 length:816 start_codon:yes stop_codon:yes gene_type:complete
MKSDFTLKDLANELRYALVKASYDTGAPHLASCLSCVDLLTLIYFRFAHISIENADDAARDRVILSKGHAASILYQVLNRKGLISDEVLQSYARDGGVLAEHPGPDCAPGVEWATGSLGHGLSAGLGMGLAARIQKHDYRVFVVLGDGECNEGSVWEAALFASAQKMSNLTVFIDFNKWQGTGRSQEIMSLDPLMEKWAAFGWHSVDVDGHDLDAISAVYKQCRHAEKPTAIICHTIKGKGVSFMEDDNNWHYRIPKKAEVMMAGEELGQL